MGKKFKKKKIFLSEKTIEKILKLRHDEFLETWEIAKMLGISERDVVMVVSPNW